MAHTKAKGSTKLGRDSVGRRLGVKKSGGEFIKSGEIIIRQRGTHYFPGTNVKIGRDDTLYSLADGRVQFLTRERIRFDGKKIHAKFVNVLPA